MELTRTPIFILSLIVAWLIGIIFRFLMMSVEEINRRNIWNDIFDWGILFILVFILIIYFLIKKRGEKNGL